MVHSVTLRVMNFLWNRTAHTTSERARLEMTNPQCNCEEPFLASTAAYANVNLCIHGRSARIFGAAGSPALLGGRGIPRQQPGLMLNRGNYVSILSSAISEIGTITRMLRRHRTRGRTRTTSIMTDIFINKSGRVIK